MKRALIMGIERHTNDRELISRLLSAVHPLFEGKGYDEGFQALLDRLPDMVIDVPDAADYLGLFLARAMYDEALPPSFLSRAIVGNEPAKHATTLAYNVYHEPSERSRLEQVRIPLWLLSLIRSGVLLPLPLSTPSRRLSTPSSRSTWTTSS